MINRSLIAVSFFLIGVSLVNAQELTKQDSIIKTKEIQEVLIKSQRKRQYADKAVYTFDKEALGKARHSKDLLITLPELQLDPVSNTVSSIKGGRVLFLINGIEASDMQFRAVHPANVIRVEFFDIVPTRWENKADTVVNMITRNPEHGLAYGTDIMVSPSTGFVNGSAYLNHTRGSHDFGLEYNLGLRDYDNRLNTNSYEYILNQSKYKSTESQKDHFGYTIQDIAMRYTYQQPEKQTFQAKLSFNIMGNFSKGNGESIFEQGVVSTLNKTTEYQSGQYFKPTLDLYYANQINKKNELIFNLVGSIYYNKIYQKNREWIAVSGLDIFNNEMHLNAKQSSFVGEVAHNHTFDKAKLSSGYKVTNNSIANNLQNLAGKSQYDVNYLEQYFYSELSGSKKKLGYRIGAGLTGIQNKSAEATFNEWTFTPRVILAYRLKNNKNLRFTSVFKPYNPTSSQLSSNVVNLAPNIVKSGNPLLKSEKTWSNNLIYSYNSKYFDFNTTIGYTHRNRAINQYFIMDKQLNQYALTYENADYYQNYRWEFSGSIKPFGNQLLTIKTYLRPTAETIKLKDEKMMKNTYLKNYLNLTSQYKKWFAQYQFNIPTYSIDGAFLSTEENQNHLVIGYSMGNWMLKGGVYWIGMPSEYKTKSLNESLVNYTSHTQIFNNKNMLLLGFSYNFARGKSTEVDKKIENQTAEAANF